MLGIGIFLSPPIVAQNVASPALYYLLWVLGGVVSLAGAVACAELGTLMPKAGGDYVFQYEAFGPSVAFASGWVLFAAIFSGSIATMAVGLCQYQLPVLLGVDLSVELLRLPWGSPLTGAEAAALLLVPILTVLNTLGASPSTRTQAVFTFVPIAALSALALYGIVLAPGTVATAAVAAAAPAGTTTLHGIVVSYMAVYFAYSGWINIIYVAGEVEDPKRNIPLSLIGGTLAVTALYLLLCFAFVCVLGFEGLAEAGEAGSVVGSVLGGEAGRMTLTVLIASALIASINGTILGGARVAYAMGRQGAMWPKLGTITETHHAPRSALWLQTLLSTILILSGRFEELYSMVSLAMVVTGTLTVASVFVLRRSMPDAPRPYLATGYPWFPALYIVSSLGVLGVMINAALSGEPGAWHPLIGLGILVGAYFFHRIGLRQGFLE